MIVTQELFDVLIAKGVAEPHESTAGDGLPGSLKKVGSTAFGSVFVGDLDGAAAIVDPVEFGYLCGRLSDYIDIDTRVGVRKALFLGHDVICRAAEAGEKTASN